MAKSDKKKKAAKSKSGACRSMFACTARELGDCFLLRFETEKGKYFSMLIDCGIYKGEPRCRKDHERDRRRRGRRNRRAPQRARLDTQNTGTTSPASRRLLKKFHDMTIDEVWQAWTEDRKTPLRASP